MFLCGRGGKPDCMGTGEVPNLDQNKMGIHISWHCDQKPMPGHVIYCLRLDNQQNCAPGPGLVAMYPDPTDKQGNRIVPNHLISPNGTVMMDNLGTDHKIVDDPTRVRADGMGGIDEIKFSAMAVYE